MKLPPISFTILDTETTGFVPRVHRVIEFASIRVEEGTIVDEYEQLFAIGEELPPIIRALTHIHDSNLKGQPAIDEKRKEIFIAPARFTRRPTRSKQSPQNRMKS